MKHFIIGYLTRTDRWLAWLAASPLPLSLKEKGGIGAHNFSETVLAVRSRDVHINKSITQQAIERPVSQRRLLPKILSSSVGFQRVPTDKVSRIRCIQAE